jgi:hypothetical protein
MTKNGRERNLQKEKDRREEAARNRKKGQPRTQKGATNSRQLNGLNVSRIKSQPNITKATIPVAGTVMAWSDLLRDPFGAASEGVYPPITNDVVPCPSTKVRNYGTTSITVQSLTVGTIPQGIAFWFYPGGRNNNGRLTGFQCQPSNTSTPQNSQFGPILDGEDDATSRATAGVYTVILNTSPVITTMPLDQSATQQIVGMPWDELENPFSIPSTNSDVQFKITALGVRITYVGKLADTEGFVDFYNPYDWSGTPGDPREMNSLRRDPSHRRGYFSNQRTHTFVWHPNCESSTYGLIDVNPITLGSVPSRFMMQVGGVEKGDKFEVEYIGFQEFKGPRAVATNTPSPVADDMLHVANAIPALKGKMNKGASNGPTSTLEQHVQASKMLSKSKIFPDVSPHDSIGDVVAKHVKGGKKEGFGAKVLHGIESAAEFLL